MITFQEEQKAAKLAARNRIRRFRSEDADLEDLEQVAIAYILIRGPHEEFHYALRNGYNGIAEFRRKLYGRGQSRRARANKVYPPEDMHFASMYEGQEPDPTPAFENQDRLAGLEDDMTEIELLICRRRAQGVHARDIAKEINLLEWQIQHTLHLLRKRMIEREQNRGRSAQQALDHWRHSKALQRRPPNRVQVDRQRDAQGMEGSR